MASRKSTKGQTTIYKMFFVFHVNTHYSDTPIHIRVENLFDFEMKNRDIRIRESV
jgi:hypothetical protein